MSPFFSLFVVITLIILIFIFFVLGVYHDIFVYRFYKERHKNVDPKTFINRKSSEAKLFKIFFYWFVPENSKVYYRIFFLFFFAAIQFVILGYFFYSIDCVWSYRKIFEKWKRAFFFVCILIFSTLLHASLIIDFYESNAAKLNNLNIFLKIILVCLLSLSWIFVFKFVMINIFGFSIPRRAIYSMLYALLMYYQFPKKLIFNSRQYLYGWEDDSETLYIDFVSNFFLDFSLNLAYINIFWYFFFMQILILILYFCFVILIIFLMFRNFNYEDKMSIIADIKSVLAYGRCMCFLVFIFSWVVFFFGFFKCFYNLIRKCYYIY